MYDESVVEEQPLSTENITFSFCNINYLQDEAFISLVSDELKVPDDKVGIGIRRMIKICGKISFAALNIRTLMFTIEILITLFILKSTVIIVAIVSEYHSFRMM